ncbi:uncharacterized protein E0L32_000499 [Thyridium curvatum]|uniref:lytic cellulose monooxygenase (C4-dehydrogenating) n=1 Tax=Thyridium curvatum TaxID=1093900 RepID=A0A507ATG5_9PEZI|nr:uncharacterized protein E0L32_000499 [Thyridium curvatum]TPX14105.1 hypothetical protein E0L32_000499 [Thyridium curvatum]
MKSLAVVLGAVGLVAAHGYVDNATIGGNYYQASPPSTSKHCLIITNDLDNIPYSDPYMNPAPQRVERPIPGNGPVQDVTLIDIQCNGWSAGGTVGSKPAPLHAPAAAGSAVTLHWTLWPDSHVGPVITYMARCPDSGCQSWQPGTSAVWFKIKEGGRDGTSNNWATTPFMRPGSSYVYNIPSCLKSGYYLVRHEIIALHASSQYPGAQFYPGCHQLQVTGGGSTVPSSNLVAFPGAYKGSDPGITYDAYKPQTYIIPGPKVFSC